LFIERFDFCGFFVFDYKMQAFDLTRGGGVSLKGLKRDFTGLTGDPYIGARLQQKNMVRFLVKKGKRLYKRPHLPLYEEDGNIKFYWEYEPCNEAFKVINEFVDKAGIVDGQEILVQAKRVNAPGLVGMTMVQKKDLKKLGIFFVEDGRLVVFEEEGIKSNALKKYAENSDPNLDHDILVMSYPSQYILL
jgi:hypothetical protein